MFYKEELKKVPLCSIPKLSKEELNEKEIIARVQIVDLQRSGNVLNIDYYSIADKKIQARFFYDKETYICYDCKKDKFHNGYLYRSFFDETIRQTFKVFETDNDVSIALKYFGRNRNSLCSCYIDNVRGYYCLCEPTSLLSFADGYIQDIKREKRWEANERKNAIFKERTLWFPDETEGIKKFCIDKVFTKSYIFFSNKIYDKGKKRKCYCTHCHKSWKTSDSPKQKSYGVCPKCNSPVQFYSERYETNISHDNIVCISVKHNENIGIKWCECNLTYYENKPRVTLEDVSYTFFIKKNDTVKTISYFWAKGMYYDYHWTLPKYNEKTHKLAFIYTDGLNNVFGENFHNVNLEEILSRQQNPVDFIKLIENIKEIPQAEYMCKLGLITLASQLYSEDYLPGNSFETALGISKYYAPIYRSLDIRRSEHEIIKHCKEKISRETILEFRNMFCKSEYITENFTDCLKYQRLDTLLNYIKKESIAENVSQERIIGWLKDYYNANICMDVEITKDNVRPAKLKKNHDLAVKRYNKIKAEIKDKTSKKLLAQVNSFFKGYSDENFLIKMPEYRSDFIKEGQTLNHCVGNDSYYSNHILGKRLIFFVRKTNEPDKPYVTAEIDMNTFRVCQCYGAHDRLPPKPVKKFVDGFALSLKNSNQIRKAG